MIPIGTNLTVWEWHAAVLGLGGMVPGAMVAAGQVQAALAVAAPVVAVALGVKRRIGDEDSKAEQTIRREPWYFLTVFVTTAVATVVAVVSGMVPA